jgi:O-antigen polymerase
MLKNIVLPFVMIAVLIITLLNSNAFGSPTYISLFGYILLIPFVSILIFFYLLLSKRSLLIPLHFFIFFLLCLYLSIPGLLNGTLHYLNYYWLACALLLVLITVLYRNLSKDFHASPKQYTLNKVFHFGILVLSLIESIVVIFQFVNVFPTPTEMFSCTGTWINPNVTASFLTLCIFSVFQLKKCNVQRWVTYFRRISLSIVVIAIILLRCRSAYLMTMMLLGFEYFAVIRSFIVSNFRFNIYSIAKLSLVVLMPLLMINNVFNSKKDSTNSRVFIWQNSAQLIKVKPLFGYGVGSFEKEYSNFLITHSNPQNDHVNMAYNDFLEITVEGGLIAFFLWIGFLYCIWKYTCQSSFTNKFTPLLLAFIILQLTNFGFQAIPTFVLFLTYVGLNSDNNEEMEYYDFVGLKISNKLFLNKYLAVIISVVVLYKTATLVAAFYRQWDIVENNNSKSPITDLEALNTSLWEYSSYHENLADSYIKTGNYVGALKEYNEAFVRNGNPKLITKIAQFYYSAKKYDSCIYYCSLLKKVQAKKLTPLYLLLKTYEKCNDTTKMLSIANDIINKPVKVTTNKSIFIKKYAATVTGSTNDKLMQ